MKPRIFIGSSSENLRVAEALQQALDHHAEVTPWHLGTFGPSEYPLESLEAQVGAADFAAFIFAPDDAVEMRGENYSAVRDNVIFELGLFIGKLGRKRSFVVRPRGVDIRLPTDLHGLNPVEYDAAREDGNLEAALGPAAVRIRKAMANEGPLKREQTAPAKSPEVAKETPAPISSARKLESYFDLPFQYFAAVSEGDSELCAEINRKFHSKSEVSDQEKNEWEAWKHYAALTHGRPQGSLAGLIDLAQAHPSNIRIASLLCRVHLQYGDKGSARRVALKALDQASTLSDISSLIIILAEADTAVLARNLKDLRERLTPPGPDEGEGISAGRYGLKALATATGFVHLSTSIDEVILQHNPDNISLRFSLAYLYSEEGNFFVNEDLALFHYDAVPVSSRSSVTWNNIGVSLDRLKMPGLSVKSYEMALKDSEGLPESNIAMKYIAAGFFDEAREIASKAISSGKKDARLPQALMLLAEREEAEKQTRQAAVAQGAKKRDSLVLLGNAALARGSFAVTGRWNIGGNVVELSDHGDGSYQGSYKVARTPSGLVGLFAPSPQFDTFEIVLRRFGDAFEGTIRTPVTHGASVSLLGTTERNIVAYPSEGGDKLVVLTPDLRWEETVWLRVNTHELTHG